MHGDERYVIGVDSSTQSVKAIAWSRDGMPRAEGRATHTISQPHPLKAEQNADDWWTAAASAIAQVAAEVGAGNIDGLAISNQRETMVLLDRDRKPLAPATLWLDRRAIKLVPVLAEEIGAERLHRITGKPIDITPCVYRLRYMREYEPDLLDEAAQILSVHDFLLQKLSGEAAASWTSAGPFGIFDIRKKEWSREILDHLEIPVEKLPAVHRPGTMLGQVTREAAELTGLLAGTPIFAAGGDGHCAALGVGAVRPGIAYLNLGTAVVGGPWSANADIDRYWRTLLSPTGEGYLLESCQRAGAFFVNWLLDLFAGGQDTQEVFRMLEAQASALPVGSGGVMASTYLVGCMDPHWDLDARAGFMGLGPEAGFGHIYRASLEAITLEFVRSLDQMRKLGVPAERIFVIGGGANSPLWRQMVADASGLPVVRSLSNEASALGAGMSAAVGAGWYDGFQSAASGMSRLAEEIAPNADRYGEWQDLSGRQSRIYSALADI